MKHLASRDSDEWLSWPLINIRKRHELRSGKKAQKAEYRLFCVDLGDSLSKCDNEGISDFLRSGESVCIKWYSDQFLVIELLCPISDASRRFLKERGHDCEQLVAQDIYLLPNNEHAAGMRFNALVVTDCIATLDKGGASIRLTNDLMLPIFECSLHFESPFISNESCRQNRDLVIEWLINKIELTAHRVKDRAKVH